MHVYVWGCVCTRNGSVCIFIGDGGASRDTDPSSASGSREYNSYFVDRLALHISTSK